MLLLISLGLQKMSLCTHWMYFLENALRAYDFLRNLRCLPHVRHSTQNVPTNDLNSIYPPLRNYWSIWWLTTNTQQVGLLICHHHVATHHNCCSYSATVTTAASYPNDVQVQSPESYSSTCEWRGSNTLSISNDWYYWQKRCHRCRYIKISPMNRVVVIVYKKFFVHICFRLVSHFLLMNLQLSCHRHISRLYTRYIAVIWVAL